MKRKKWSELEEQTLLTKYSDLHATGTLAKLKTREKKFKPIADHVNSLHHFRDPINFPFKWSWRDVSIKVQNMRHQYLGVKQKIRVSESEYDWEDGENHWENFLKYKEVFGDFELGTKDNYCIKKIGDEGVDIFGDSGFGYMRNGGDGFLGLGFDELENDDDNNGGDDDDEEEEEGEDSEFICTKKLREGFGGRKLGLVSAQVLELRDVMMRREEKRREREWKRDECVLEREERKIEREFRLEKRQQEMEIRALELEEKQISRARKEFESRLILEAKFDEERRRKMKLEETWEEEEMKWKEKMMNMQIEHEKQMMQLQADACQNQMQVLGVMGRFLCQFFGSANDGLGGLPQVLQNLQHPGGLDDNGKPDANSPSEFI